MLLKEENSPFVKLKAKFISIYENINHLTGCADIKILKIKSLINYGYFRKSLSKIN